jgi:hypothetical protein
MQTILLLKTLFKGTHFKAQACLMAIFNAQCSNRTHQSDQLGTSFQGDILGRMLADEVWEVSNQVTI